MLLARVLGRTVGSIGGRTGAIFAAVVLAALLSPVAANATITSVFEGKVTCTEQTKGAEAGQRWCGNSAGTTVPSFDGTPIDVAVAFPPATGADNDYPVVGIYHGWGSTKITPSSAMAQRWLKQGYAVFSQTDRGWGDSCKSSEKTKAGCEHGYVHLMSRRYEVHDAQYLLSHGDVAGAAAATDEARDIAGRLHCQPLMDRAEALIPQDSSAVRS